MIIHTARPGIIIGKKGSEVEKLRKDLKEMTGKEVSIDIKEIRKPEVDAQLVAENIALQLEKRVAFRRAMKKSVASALRFGTLGVKVSCSGRLAGARDSPLRVVQGRKSPSPYIQGGYRLWVCKGKDNLWNHRSKGLDVSWRYFAGKQTEGSFR